MSWAFLSVVYGVHYGISLQKRSRFFTKSFLNEHFREYHQIELPEVQNVPHEGEPDDGNGRYADKLFYSQWLEFNCATRCFYSCLEQLVILVPLSMLIAVFSNWLGALINCTWALARVIFTVGCLYHPDKRVLGGIISDFLLIWALIITGVLGANFLFGVF